MTCPLQIDPARSFGPSAYTAISIPDFPNFLMLNGPNGPVGNFSPIEVAELQWSYVMQLVDLVRSGRCRELSATKEATRQFDEDRQKAVDVGPPDPAEL